MSVIGGNGGDGFGPCSIHLKGEEANNLHHNDVREIVDQWMEMMIANRPALPPHQFDIGGNIYQIDPPKAEDLLDNKIILKMVKARPQPISMSFKVKYAFSITAEANRKKDEGMPWWRRLLGDHP